MKTNLANQNRHLLWMLMEFSIGRYLLSNTHGRLNGFEKAERHIELCAIFIAAKTFSNIDSAKSHEDLMLIHDATQKLTGNLDKEIGFPIDEQPEDYDELARNFFNKFINLAEDAWKSR